MWQGMFRQAAVRAGIRKHTQVGGKWVATPGESGGGGGGEKPSAEVSSARAASDRIKDMSPDDPKAGEKIEQFFLSAKAAGAKLSEEGERSRAVITETQGRLTDAIRQVRSSESMTAAEARASEKGLRQSQRDLKRLSFDAPTQLPAVFAGNAKLMRELADTFGAKAVKLFLTEGGGWMPEGKGRSWSIIGRGRPAAVLEGGERNIAEARRAVADADKKIKDALGKR